MGNKGGQGIKEPLLNCVPIANRYFSLFYGQGGFENLPDFKNIKWSCSEKCQGLQSFSTMQASIVENDYKSLIDKNNCTSDDFVFADPPYMLSTRRSGKRYYKHEFSTENHIEFLSYASGSPAMWLITHPPCALYNRLLQSWLKIPMGYQTRNGYFEDCIWLNFNPKLVELVTYKYLGNNFIERQQIKRKRANLVKKFKALTFHEQQAILQELDLK